VWRGLTEGMVPGSQYNQRTAKEDFQKNGRGGSAAQGDPESQTTGKLVVDKTDGRCGIGSWVKRYGPEPSGQTETLLRRVHTDRRP
jgi:hypothetical protein